MARNKNFKRIQLRGEALQKRIDEVIRELADRAKRHEQEFVYNATHVADMVPTTRKTLLKYDDFVESIVADLKARRRMSTGEATVEQLRDQVASLKEKIAEKERIIDQLRAHHIHIYEQLHSHSVKGEALIRPILQQESHEAGCCILCGIGGKQDNRRAKVVSLAKKGK